MRIPGYVRATIHRAIKRHAGLSDFDDEGIEAEVKAICRALEKEGYEVKKP